MAWPTSAVATGELITASQLNGLPVMIADSTLSGDAASITFSSIPGHYAHLMVVWYLRGSTAAAQIQTYLRFNADSGANYDQQFVLGQAAVASAGEAFAQTATQIGNIPGSTAGANLFAAGSFQVPHYANAANNKSAVSTWAHKEGTASTNLQAGGFAGFWRSNAAITQVTVVPTTGNLVSGSRVTLYGLA